MEAKHTAGPWTHRNGRIFATDRENLTIAHVARAEDGDYSPANGQLLAAAPDLLDALRAAYSDIQRLPGHTIDMLGRIEAAIAKATAS